MAQGEIAADSRDVRQLQETAGSEDFLAARPSTRRDEIVAFLFFTVVLAPALAVAVVGAYGFAVWMTQLVAGPPTG